MRRVELILSAALVSFAAIPFASAQGLEVPAPSPKARVEQRLGLTNFSVDYSSPGVKGRKIWGDLVPYNQLWRTGANMATKLTASRDFDFGGKKVKAGSYAIFTIPGEKSWTVMLNTNHETGGTNGYDKKNDVATITVKPEAISPGRERLTFLFSDTTDDATRLDLEWEKLRVSVPIKVDTKAHVTASIDSSLNEAWRPHFTAARYALDNNGDLKAALGWIDTSIAIKPTWWNNWVRAQILAKQGRSSDAVAAAEKAQTLGKGDRVYEEFFKEEVIKALGEWKKKS